MPKASRKKQTRAARQAASDGPVAGRTDSNNNSAPAERAAVSLPILKKLASDNSASASDQRWACAGLANLLADSDASTRRMLQSHKVVDLLIKMCAHTEITVKAEAVGALRNMAVAGGTEVCAEMVNKGVVASLAAHFDAIGHRIQGSVSYAEDSQNHGMLWDWAENLCILVWSLAESSPKCLPSLNNVSTLPSFLLLLIQSYATQDFNPPPPVTVALSSLHALSVLTDGNSDFSLSLTSLQLEPLLTLLSNSNSKTPSKNARIENQRYLCRVLALCVLLNIVAAKPHTQKRKVKQVIEDLKSEMDPVAFPVLLEGLSSFRAKMGAADEEDLQDFMVLLEVLAEVCNSLDGLDDEREGEWQGIQNAGDDEEEEDQDGGDAAMDEDQEDNDDDDGVVGGGAGRQEDDVDESMMEDMADLKAQDELALPDSTLGLVQQHHLPDNLLAVALYEPQTPGTAEGLLPTATAALDSFSQSWLVVRQRALESLNNFFFTLARQHASSSVGPQVLRQAWESCMQMTTRLASTPNDALKASVGCLWALASLSFGADKKGNKSYEHVFEVSDEEIRFLLNMLQSTSVGKDDLVAEIQNRIAGALAVLGSREGVPLDQNEAIGSALVSPFASLNADEQPSTATLSLVAQVLDSFIDLYADETKPTDKVFRSKGFLEVLRAALPTLHAMSKRIDKRNLPELRFRMDAGVINLRAFIKFRDGLP